MCLISMSVAHLQHEFSRNLDNPPMDKSKSRLHINAKTTYDTYGYQEPSNIPEEMFSKSLKLPKLSPILSVAFFFSSQKNV